MLDLLRHTVRRVVRIALPVPLEVDPRDAQEAHGMQAQEHEHRDLGGEVIGCVGGAVDLRAAASTGKRRNRQLRFVD